MTTPEEYIVFKLIDGARWYVAPTPDDVDRYTWSRERDDAAVLSRDEAKFVLRDLVSPGAVIGFEAVRE